MGGEQRPGIEFQLHLSQTMETWASGLNFLHLGFHVLLKMGFKNKITCLISTKCINTIMYVKVLPQLEVAFFLPHPHLHISFFFLLFSLKIISCTYTRQPKDT
jgi:hypothetical protein